MRVDIHVDGSDAELRSLYRWLRDEPELRRTAEISLAGPDAEPGDMGTVLDIVQLVTGNAWSAASFAVSVAAWKQSRSRPPRVTVQRGAMEITLTDCNQEEVRRIVALFTDQPTPEPGSGSTEDHSI
ncbi:hypothetical protein [Streptomyces sp. NPDC048669]|uniref:effector-associated constant component EACC1 n=1 Tax=Streptomyces sp. NPDC048669 TaxID=3155267 RepID=UPI0034145C77